MRLKGGDRRPLLPISTERPHSPPGAGRTTMPGHMAGRITIMADMSKEGLAVEVAPEEEVEAREGSDRVIACGRVEAMCPVLVVPVAQA